MTASRHSRFKCRCAQHLKRERQYPSTQTVKFQQHYLQRTFQSPSRISRRTGGKNDRVTALTFQVPLRSTLETTEKRIAYKGYGKRKPISTNRTPEGRLKNQRVEIKILRLEGD